MAFCTLKKKSFPIQMSEKNLSITIRKKKSENTVINMPPITQKNDKGPDSFTSIVYQIRRIGNSCLMQSILEHRNRKTDLSSFMSFE